MPSVNQQIRGENPTAPAPAQAPAPAAGSDGAPRTPSAGTGQATQALQVAVPAQEEGVPSEFLVSMLECPVCFCYMMPPIMQCPRGHLICQPCRQQVTSCPVCRMGLTTIRNLAMEQVASKLIFPCRYAHLGCRARLAYADKNHHEERCDYSHYRCPYPDEKCVWQGPLTEVYQHLLGSHENVITMEGTDIIFLATNVNLEGALDWTMVQTCHGRHFLLSLEKAHDDSQQFIATCRIIGSVRDAAEFTYSITLEGHNRSLRWKSTPKSIRENFVFGNADYLVLNKITVQLFAKDGDLALNVVIKKSQASCEV